MTTVSGQEEVPGAAPAQGVGPEEGRSPFPRVFRSGVGGRLVPLNMGEAAYFPASTVQCQPPQETLPPQPPQKSRPLWLVMPTHC